jgi:cell division protein FtsN
MSVFGTLGTRNVLILFFSALSISLLLLLVLFSVFFKNLDLSVKTKDLATAPTLGTESSSPGDVETEPASPANPWSSEAIRQKLNLILPGEAKKLKDSVENQTKILEGDVSKSPKTNKNVKPEEYYMGVEADPSSVTLDEDGETTYDSGTPAPTPTDDASAMREDTPPKVNVVQPAPAPKMYRVYMGGFGSRADAEGARANLQAQGYSAVLKQGGAGYQLQLGVFGDESRARQLAGQTGASVEAQ